VNSNPLAWISFGVLTLAAIMLASKKDDAVEAEEGNAAPPEPKPDPYERIPAHANVLLLGDSIGVGIAPHLKPLVTGSFEARVKTGRTTQGAVAALQGDEKDFDVILLSLGSNDALLDPGGYPAALGALVGGVRSAQNHVFWIVPPGFTYGTTKSVHGANVFTAAMHDADVNALIASPVAPAPDDPMHLHLSPKGYDAFAHAIAEGIYA
jgi:lysophospholipase L1-like esterase